MASKNKDYKPEDIAFPEQHIVQSELVGEMTTSYIEYAMSVIIGRALPTCATVSSPCTAEFCMQCTRIT